MFLINCTTNLETATTTEGFSIRFTLVIVGCGRVDSGGGFSPGRANINGHDITFRDFDALPSFAPDCGATKSSIYIKVGV